MFKALRALKEKEARLSRMNIGQIALENVIDQEALEEAPAVLPTHYMPTRYDGPEPRIRTDEWAKSEIRKVHNTARKIHKIRAAGFKELDLSFLTMRHKSKGGPPRFAVFNMDDSDCHLGWEYRGRPFNRLARIFNRVFGIRDSVVDVWRENWQCTFPGIVPAQIKKRIIAVHATDMFEEQFIISDTTPEMWKKLTAKEIAMRYDPILVGGVALDDDNGPRLFLIDTFDLAPIEEYIVREFTK